MGDGGRWWVELGVVVVAESSFPDVPFIARRSSARTFVSLCDTRSRTTFVAADEALVSLHDVHTFAKAFC